MRVKEAEADRIRRWDRWYPLLLDEIALVTLPDAHIFAVGDKVDTFLRERRFPDVVKRRLSSVMHYSPAAQAHRKRAIVGHEQRFEQFKSELSADRVLAVGHEVMAETLPPSIADEAWASLRRYSLPESDRRLIFAPKLAFEAVTRPSR